MPIVLLRFLPVNAVPKDRPRQCPICGSSVLQSWGQSLRRVQGAGEQPAQINRYRCSDCGHTFRHYPEGVDRASHNLRIRRLGAVAWALGLSYREVAAILQDRGLDISHTTIWREGRALLRQVKAEQGGRLVRYVIDREFVRLASPRLGVVVAVDFGDGRPFVLGTINSGNARDVTTWLKTLVRDSGIEANLMRTSTLDAP
jgi:DNA-directed RNA polymerase subunit RPC12/RpoP